MITALDYLLAARNMPNAVRERELARWNRMAALAERRFEFLFRRYFKDELRAVLSTLDHFYRTHSTETRLHAQSETSVPMVLTDELKDAMVKSGLRFGNMVTQIVDGTITQSVAHLNMTLSLPKSRYLPFETRQKATFTSSYWPPLVDQLTDTSMRGIKQVILKGVQTGDTLRHIQYNIEDRYAGFVRSRPTLIARTEVHRIANWAQQEVIARGPIKSTELIQVWFTAQDERVRPSHQALDGAEARVGEYFVDNDGHQTMLRFPSDPDAPPEETINCRCVLIFRYTGKSELPESSLEQPPGEEYRAPMKPAPAPMPAPEPAPVHEQVVEPPPAPHAPVTEPTPISPVEMPVAPAPVEPAQPFTVEIPVPAGMEKFATQTFSQLKKVVEQKNKWVKAAPGTTANELLSKTNIAGIKVEVGTSQMIGMEEAAKIWNKSVGSDLESFVKHYTKGLGLSDQSSLTVTIKGNEFAPRVDLKLSGWSTLGGKNGYVSISRYMDFGTRVVEHAYFSIAEELQGTSFGKQLFRNSVSMYLDTKIPLEKIEVHANIDVGGYAWFKYGYVQTKADWESLRGRLSNTFEQMLTDPATQLSAEDIQTVRHTLRSEDPKSAWDFVDLKITRKNAPLDQARSTPQNPVRQTIGKELLLGASWEGAIKMKGDREAFQRMVEYVFGR